MSNQPCGSCHRGLTVKSEVCGECDGTAIRKEEMAETVVQKVKRVVKKQVKKVLKKK